MFLIFFFQFLYSNAPNNKCNNQKWCANFYMCQTCGTYAHMCTGDSTQQIEKNEYPVNNTTFALFE